MLLRALAWGRDAVWGEAPSSPAPLGPPRAARIASSGARGGGGSGVGVTPALVGGGATQRRNAFGPADTAGGSTGRSSEGSPKGPVLGVASPLPGLWPCPFAVVPFSLAPGFQLPLSIALRIRVKAVLGLATLTLPTVLIAAAWETIGATGNDIGGGGGGGGIGGVDVSDGRGSGGCLSVRLATIPPMGGAAGWAAEWAMGLLFDVHRLKALLVNTFRLSFTIFPPCLPPPDLPPSQPPQPHSGGPRGGGSGSGGHGGDRGGGCLFRFNLGVRLAPLISPYFASVLRCGARGQCAVGQRGVAARASYSLGRTTMPSLCRSRRHFPPVLPRFFIGGSLGDQIKFLRDICECLRDDFADDESRGGGGRAVPACGLTSGTGQGPRRRLLSGDARDAAGEGGSAGDDGGDGGDGNRGGGGWHGGKTNPRPKGRRAWAVSAREAFFALAVGVFVLAAARLARTANANFARLPALA